MSNITEVNIIEGLMSQVNDHLAQIVPTDEKTRQAREQAVENINAFQTDDLYQLRTLTEGDINGI